LHGHNYTEAVRLLGSRQISCDGYVLDFGDVKKVVKVVCKRLNERFLCPVESDVIDIQIVDSENENGRDDNVLKTKSVVLVCEDGAKFVIPHDDCAMLPIVHATVEEMSIYIWGEIIHGLDPEFLRRRGIHTMEVMVSEAPGQEALFRYEIPAKASKFDIKSFIMGGEIEIEPKPCLDQEENEGFANRSQESDTSISSRINGTAESSVENTDINKSQCCESCSLSTFSTQLEQLASALNEKPRSNDITAEDLRSMLEKNNNTD
jgi:6-pyruvoyl-tetrahydropterin synthase